MLDNDTKNKEHYTTFLNQSLTEQQKMDFLNIQYKFLSNFINSII